MTDDEAARLDTFLRPLYQDLDGRSHQDEVDRMVAIARELHAETELSDAFQLLVRFMVLESWLDKVGHMSRAVLATGIDERRLRRAAASIQRLGDPQSEEERLAATARIIDGAGLRGTVERCVRARREGHTITDVAHEALAEEPVPEWMSPAARRMLAARREAARAFCRSLLEEMG